MKIWLLTNAPSPYQVDLFGAIAGSPDVELHVRYMRHGHIQPRGARFSEASTAWVMVGAGAASWGDGARLHPGGLWESAFGSHDCWVLSGLWTSMTLLGCAVILHLRGRPWVLWLERPHAAPSGSWHECLIRAAAARLRHLLLKRAAAVLCIGTTARNVYANLGIPEEKLFNLPYCCDIARFRAVDEQQITRVRVRYSLGAKTVLLFSGQMIPRKGVDTVIRIFQRIAERRSDIALLLLGDGPQRAEYEAMVTEELRPHVHFAGFVAQPELPAYFAAADIFVFPSRHDGWGVVINEACAAGLPVVASLQTGAAQDLVEDGRSGFVLDAEDIEGFVERLIRLLDDPGLRMKYGRRSRELVEPFSAANGAALFTKYLRRVLEREKNAPEAAGSSRNVA